MLASNNVLFPPRRDLHRAVAGDLVLGLYYATRGRTNGAKA